MSFSPVSPQAEASQSLLGKSGQGTYGSTVAESDGKIVKISLKTLSNVIHKAMTPRVAATSAQSSASNAPSSEELSERKPISAVATPNMSTIELKEADHKVMQLPVKVLRTMIHRVVTRRVAVTSAQNSPHATHVVSSQSKLTSAVAEPDISTIELKEDDLHPKGRYTGKMQGGMPHGKGIAVYADRAGRPFWKKYEGEWQYGKFHGKGKLTYRGGGPFWQKMDHSVSTPNENDDTYRRSQPVDNDYLLEYDGEWENDLPHGWGKMLWCDMQQTEYEGEFSFGKREGKGKMTNAFGDVYEGDWKNDLKHGQGKEKRGSLDDEYEGEFCNHCRHGKGNVKYGNGNTYEGEWEKGFRDGQGKMVIASTKTTIDGIWLKGMFKSGICGDLRYSEGQIQEKANGQKVVIDKNGVVRDRQLWDDCCCQ